MTTWVIVGDIDAQAVREIAVADIGRPDVIAVHPDRRSAELGVEAMVMMRAAIAAKLDKSREIEAQCRQLLEKARTAEQNALDGLKIERQMQAKLIAMVLEMGRPR